MPESAIQLSLQLPFTAAGCSHLHEVAMGCSSWHLLQDCENAVSHQVPCRSAPAGKLGETQPAAHACMQGQGGVCALVVLPQQLQ